MLLFIKRIFILLMLLIVLLAGIYYLNPYGVESQSIMERITGGTIYRIPSRSMEPTLRPGDYIFVSTVSYKHHKPQIKDIIVFTRQDASLAVAKKIPYIKRVVAVGGEQVKIERGKVLLNGKLLKEHYVQSSNNSSPYSNQMKIKQVPKGFVFVLGDNRDNSSDGRVFGMIPLSDVLGKATRLLYGRNSRSWKVIQ